MIVSLVQLDASWKKPVITAAAAASAALAGYYDRNEMAPVMPSVNVSNFNQISAKKLTDSDFYKPTTDEFKKIGMNYPTFSLKNNYESMPNDESIEGLRFDALTTDEQRVKYVHNAFQGFQLSDDLNLPLIAHYALGMQDSIDRLIAKIKEY